MKVCSDFPCHMTKMGNIPINDMNPSKIFVSGTKSPIDFGLSMKHWRCGLYQVCLKMIILG